MTMKTVNIYIITLLTGFLCLQGCGEDHLDLEPISAIRDDGFYSTTEEIEVGVLAIYDGLQQVPLREFALTEMRSDNTRTNLREGDWAQFEFLDVESTNVAVADYWSANYNAIFRANLILENSDVVENETLRAQFNAEAKFARAMAHFNLVRAYGDVPILDRVIGLGAEGEEYYDRDPAANVLEFIVDDLEDAMASLPSRGGIAEGRATNGAAKALLAKVYLTQDNYVDAEVLLSELVTDANYALQENYNDVFYSERNSEIIFAIQYRDDDAQESQDFSFEMTVDGVGSGLNYITDEFIAALEPGDTIRSKTLFSEVDPLEVGKFITASSDARLCGNDWIVLRLADVLLMHAEAIMAGAESTSNPRAITSYNAVRERAELPTLAPGGSEELTKQMLLHERRVELAFENHRFYDLIRFDEAINVLSVFAEDNGFAFSPNDLRLPIPQLEINVSNDKLKQNEGYN